VDEILAKKVFCLDGSGVELLLPFLPDFAVTTPQFQGHK